MDKALAGFVCPVAAALIGQAGNINFGDSLAFILISAEQSKKIRVRYAKGVADI